MKNLSTVLLEKLKINKDITFKKGVGKREHTKSIKEFKTTLFDFFKWYSGDYDFKKVTELYLDDIGLSDYITDDFDMTLPEVIDFLNDHLHEEIYVYSKKISGPQDAIENEIDIEDKTLYITSQSWFGTPPGSAI